MKTFKEFLLMEEELKEYEDRIDISSKKLKEIPKEYRYDKVGRDFRCDYNEITSLKGSPKEVGRNFSCGYNKLTSLDGAPKKVGGDFWCVGNQLTSLKGSPKEVRGNFYCDNNQLTSLNGIPKEVRGDFWCLGNPNLFEVSPILNSEIEGKIYYTQRGDDEVSIILNKYKNNPKNLIKMLAELKKINMRFC